MPNAQVRGSFLSLEWRSPERAAFPTEAQKLVPGGAFGNVQKNRC